MYTLASAVKIGCISYHCYIPNTGAMSRSSTVCRWQSW